MKSGQLLLIICLLPLVGAAQELPPIIRYVTDDYRAGNQNWMIGQDQNRFIYVANNEGLLEYNGEDWQLYPTPDGSIVRSVLAHEDRIYTGSYMDFGYWSRAAMGQLHYQSLTQGIREKIIEEEQFWNILHYEDLIIFQSFQQLFLLDPVTGEIEIIRPSEGITKVMSLDKKLYFSSNSGGLYELASAEINELISPQALNDPIIHTWRNEEQLYVQTTQTGTFKIGMKGLVTSDQLPFLANKRIYSAIERRQGGHIFGTISSGIFVTDADGNLEYRIDQINGLTNNTILSLFQDEKNNIWAGTDNGVSCISLPSPLRKFTDRSGQLGTVHASARFQGKLYLGSNQGLFVESPDAEESYSLVRGTRGQVWSLYEHEGELFCGHTDGTYLISSNGAQLVSSQSGTWTIDSIPGKPNLLLQGNYSGLSVLEKTLGEWQLRNVIEGFDYSARFMVLKSGPEVYVSHEYRGTYGLELDPDFRRVIQLQEYTQPPKGKNGGLAQFRDSVYHYSKAGFYVLKNFENGFVRSNSLSKQISPEEYISGSMSANENRLWFSTKTGISYFRTDGLRKMPKRRSISIDHELVNAKSGYENVTFIGEQTQLIGTADGYLLLAQNVEPDHEHEIYLAAASNRLRRDSIVLLSLTEPAEIAYSGNDLSFTLTVPDYDKFFHPYFQYRLTNRQTEWTSWSEDNVVNFSQLGYGDYLFEARSLLGSQVAENQVSYNFTILRPWYASYLAIFLYFFGGAFLTYLMNKAYSTYYRNKAKKWQEDASQKEAVRMQETELKLTRVENDLLQRDIENKNREAAIATMNLVKQNELLQQIKKSLLAKQDQEKNIKSVIRTIDQNLDTDENWNLFKEAFENADRDFFKKTKQAHPELTPNDLRVCAYLRLNLTTKEIASLLNISGRSVEVKRYRLRKKLNLERNEGLVEYILSL